MDTNLDEAEVRVLGCLIEKELATPEYYPLSLNALVNACNQKSNRDPLMNLEEEDVVRALDSLRFKQMALVSAEGGRVPKYRHTLVEKLRLDPAELSLLGELLLRGPQTMGELRARAERMHPFADLAAVEEALQELMERTPPLVTRLPRQPGRKEQRCAHLFAGAPEPVDEGRAVSPEAGRIKDTDGNERIAILEKEIASLRADMEELRRTVKEFMARFE
jgi:uncharacterized protein YceH (UPF0502 family)